MNLKKLNKSTLIIFAWLMLFTLNVSAQTNSLKENPIDRQVLHTFADSVVTKWANKEIDLFKPFSIKFGATLNEDGKFNIKSPTVISFDGDEDILRVAKSAVIAVGESGWLSYLKTLGVKEIEALVLQDKEKFLVRIISKTKSEKEAITLSRGFRGLLSISKIQKLNYNEQIIINSFKTPTNDGSNMILDFEMPINDYAQLVHNNLQNASTKIRVVVNTKPIDDFKEQSIKRERDKQVIARNLALKEFWESLITKWENKEIDYTKSFSVELEGTFTGQSKFISGANTIYSSKTEFTESTGDKDIVDLVKSSLEIVVKSDTFNILRNLSVENFKVSVSQDTNNFSARLTSNMKSEAQAAYLAHYFNTMLLALKYPRFGELKETDKILYNSFKTSKNLESQMILEIEMTKPNFQKLLNKSLKERSKK